MQERLVDASLPCPRDFPANNVCFPPTTELAIECQYNREQKKRGKASRKELAERAAIKDSTEANLSRQQSSTSATSDNLLAPGAGAGASIPPSKKKSKKPETAPNRLIRQNSSFAAANARHSSASVENMAGMVNTEPRSFYPEQMPPSAMYPQDFPGSYEANMQPDDGGENSADYTGSEHSFSPYATERFPNYRHGAESLNGQIAMSHASNSTFHGLTGFGKDAVSLESFSASWQNAMSNQGAFFPTSFPTATFGAQTVLRYPVLEPLIPHLGNIVPIPLACELLDFYFKSSSTTHQHPMSPFILGYLFRRQSFFHPTNPRKCQPALLASILWVAAQTSDAIALTSVPSARVALCRKLLKLTLDLLKPVTQDTPSAACFPVGQALASGGMPLGMDMDMDGNTNGHTLSLDDIIVHIHLATVMTASEQKSGSLRWWTMAWSLAQELKLGREVSLDGLGASMTLEEREERRRVWWMLYIVDRHLALCYNSSLHFLDTECAGLKLPIDDTLFQVGDFESQPCDDSEMDSEHGMMNSHGGRGIQRFQCRGHGIFGYFLPLMFILSNIITLHHQQNHPTFGEDFYDASHWNAQTVKITQYLQIFEDSLRIFHRNQRNKHNKTSMDLQRSDSRSLSRSRTDLQTRIVLTYSTYILHVLHILLAGKWDPVDLLDNSETWISSQAFLSAMSHAVSAAEALREILKLDPGVEFMPFFFGIYLFQGSLLLFLITDRLKGDADGEVLKACETIIRAHDASVVTLSTNYQVRINSHFNTLASPKSTVANQEITA